MARRTRVALLGAGFIAGVHAGVLRQLAGVRVTAICDPVPERATVLGRQTGGRVFGSLDELLAAGEVDAIHVLTPPETHEALARRCLQAGLHVLVEKPLAMTAPAARELGALAEQRGVRLGVNHNLAFLPGVLRLERELASGRLGRLEHLSLVHRTPLRQLDQGQFGHFMFRAEANILWEQGVHLFSVVQRLLGPCREMTAATGEPRRLPHGARFFDAWRMELRCTRGTASVRMELGGTLAASGLEALCSDGTARVDLLRGGYQRIRSSRWPEGVDRARVLFGQGAGLERQGVAALLDFARTQLRLGGGDPFLRGMQASLGAFHRPGAGGVAFACAEDAAGVIGCCELAAARAGVRVEPFVPAALPDPGPARPGEVLVTGGTGLLGRPLVARLLAAGLPVTLLVRRPDLLPEGLREGSVRVVRGDVFDPGAVARAVQGVDCAVHMATCAGDDPAAVETAMARGARTVGEAARDAGVRRLVFVSSTAALYLGRAGPVSGDADPDPRPQLRPPYARGKIAAEAEVGRLRDGGLETVVLRPAIVLGSPCHTGLGLWVGGTHCLGWGAGRRPLPLVLARDCAAAIAAAVQADGVGGRRYALAGDVRPTARELVSELRARSGRPFRFHGQPLWWLWTVEQLKHLVKVITRRPDRQRPRWRDLASRSFRAPLDCSAARRELGWEPEADREAFLAAVLGERR